MSEIERFRAKAPRRGSLEVSTDNGAASALASVARVSSQLAGELGQMADRAAIAQGAADAQGQALSVAMPGVEYAFDGSSPATTPGGGITRGAKPFKTNDPAATDLPAHARAFLNAVSGGESGGSYNVRYTPAGPAHFADMSRHPGIFVPGPHGQTSAAGRYQFTKTTWDGVGGGSFAPENQDRQAWRLAQRDYHSRTGRSLDADLQANGLTAGILNTLSPTWAAFKSNQGRHLATYRDSLTRFASAAPVVGPDTGSTVDFAHATPAAPDPVVTAATSPGDAPAAPSGGGIRVSLTGAAGSMPQVRGGTLYGDAFNKRSAEIFTNRLDTAMRSQMEALSLQHENDPAALIEALDASRAGFFDGQPPLVRAQLEPTFEAVKLSLTRQAVNRFQADTEKRNLASFEENIASRTNDAFRLAAAGGADVDKVLEHQLGALTAQIDASPLDPLQKERLKKETANNILEARVIGGFEAQKDPAARAAYTKQFQDEWQAGTGLASKLDAKAFRRISSDLVTRNMADETAANKQAATLNRAIDGQISMMKKGWPITAAARQQLSSLVAATGNPELAANLDFMEELAVWQRAHIAAPPEILDQQIELLKAKTMKEGATEAAQVKLDVMEGLRDEMAKGLATDPLGWANRAGVAKVEPLALGDAAQLTASLTERVADANAVAAHYGVKPRYFTPAEADALKKQIQLEPLTLPSLVSGLAAGLGDTTPEAMAELSKEAPLLAHLGGLVNATGDQRVPVEIAEALKMRGEQGYKSAMPTDAKLRGAFDEEVGAALSLQPSIAGDFEAAAALAEARAKTRGIAMDDFDTPGSPSRMLFQEAIGDVLGRNMRDGVQYGGIATVNGRETVVPPDIAADSLQEMIENISLDDLLFQGEIGSANGVPIGIERLRGAQLVSAGLGRYRLALGDIAAGDPKYVPGPQGYFELDVGMLKRSQANRGERPLSQRYGNQFGR